MDSSSSSAPYNTTTNGATATNNNNNWLGFCAPNLSLFYPFFPPPPPTSGAVNSCFPHEQDDYTTAGPKLEDFLGGSGVYPGPDSTLYGEPETKAALPVDEAVGDGLFHQHQQLHHGMTITKEYSNLLQQQEQQALTTAVSPPPKKPADTFSHRTSIYRGVTRHRWTGRYEAHLWDNTCKREGQSRKGRQVYLGGYDKEEKAARAYDLAALKYWGPTTTTNFPVMDYEKELEEMKHMTRQEFVASLRRKSSGFSRGASMYRGVTRHHQHGRWQARIGRVAGNKDLYLGTFSTQEEAAEAYDIAAIKFRGGNAVTNFDISRYDVKSIAVSNLPVGGLSNKPSSSSKPPPSSAAASSSVSVAYNFPQTSSSTTLCFGSSPTEQTLCWPNQPALSIDRHHHEQTPSPVFSMGVSGGGYFGYGDDQQVMNTGSGSNVSFAVPTSSGSEYEGDGSGRSCVAKSNLSALHTLIFGME